MTQHVTIRQRFNRFYDKSIRKHTKLGNQKTIEYLKIRKGQLRWSYEAGYNQALRDIKAQKFVGTRSNKKETL